MWKFCRNFLTPDDIDQTFPFRERLEREKESLKLDASKRNTSSEMFEFLKRRSLWQKKLFALLFVLAGIILIVIVIGIFAVMMAFFCVTQSGSTPMPERSLLC